MKKGAEKNLPPEELEREKNRSALAKVSFAEGFIIFLVSASADALEAVAVFSNAIPVVGQVFWLVALGVGLGASIIIILWLAFRGAHGRRIIKKVVGNALGGIFDTSTSGAFPIRTVVLLITIWLNNRSENKTIERILDVLEKRT